MTDSLDLDDDDVVWVGRNPTGNNLSKVSELIQALKLGKLTGDVAYSWFGANAAVPGQLLKTTGGGWRKGKFRLRLEFIPDPPDQQEG